MRRVFQIVPWTKLSKFSSFLVFTFLIFIISMKSEIDCKGTKSQLYNKSFSRFFSENGKLKHLQRVDVFVEFFIKGVARHGRSIAEDDEFHSGTGNGDIHTAQVTKEANLSFVVGSDE